MFVHFYVDVLMYVYVQVYVKRKHLLQVYMYTNMYVHLYIDLYVKNVHVPSPALASALVQYMNLHL
jgi:hypothetical protein